MTPAISVGVSIRRPTASPGTGKSLHGSEIFVLAPYPSWLNTKSRRKLASDGSEYGLRSRLLAVNPLDQSITLEMQAELWRDGELEATEAHRLDLRYYFVHELRLMLEQAGFANVVVHGDHVDVAGL